MCEVLGNIGQVFAIGGYSKDLVQFIVYQWLKKGKKHRANDAGPGSSPGKSGFKAYRLYPVGIGLTPKRLSSRPSSQLLGVL